MNKPYITENTIGWIGTVMLLCAYSLNALGFIEATTYSYILLNLFGAIGAGYISYRYHNYQSALINCVWLIVAVIALVNLLRIII